MRGNTLLLYYYELEDDILKKPQANSITYMQQQKYKTKISNEYMHIPLQLPEHNRLTTYKAH